MPRIVLAILLVLLALAAPARAARIVTIDTPSRHVDAASVKWNGDDHPHRLRANVLLPDGYDGKRRFPVLYLLHGVGDAYDTWAKPARGDILNTAKGFPAVVVMPEGDRGFYTNWWNGGKRGDPGWERYYLEELVPLVERRFRIRRGRRWHAIAGLSMGGMGSTYLASQRPDLFGSVATFSGFVSHQRPEAEEGLRRVGNVEYTDIFGPRDGFYATGHNPARLTDNLRSSRLYVTVGDGRPAEGQVNPGGAIVEVGLKLEAEDLVAAARKSGVDVTYAPLDGIHDWPEWRRALRNAIAWGFFAPVAERPPSWDLDTAMAHSAAWGFRFGFRTPPEEVIRFSRRGRRLIGKGSGTVRVRTPAGRGADLKLPFDRDFRALGRRRSPP
jgi:S-formylglutathione hydrolase FrmB